MATAYQNPTDQTATSLVAGIIDDIQDLVKQQLKLAREELKQDFRKAAAGAVFMAVSVGILFFGALLCSFALVYLLHWAASPPDVDIARIPLWGCYGIVGVVLLVAGGTLAFVGGMKFKSIQPMQSPASEALKENIEWATNRKV